MNGLIYCHGVNWVRGNLNQSTLQIGFVIMTWLRDCSYNRKRKPCPVIFRSLQFAYWNIENLWWKRGNKLLFSPLGCLLGTLCWWKPNVSWVTPPSTSAVTLPPHSKVQMQHPHFVEYVVYMSLSKMSITYIKCCKQITLFVFIRMFYLVVAIC